MKNINEALEEDTKNGDSPITYLTFRIDGQYYGIPISDVTEIIQLQPATKLPELPFYSKGIINLRGRIVPLIDMNLRLGNPGKGDTERTCIIIVAIDGAHTGLIVDAVEEVLDIGDHLISKPPTISEKDSISYITRIAKLNETIVLLLDARILLSQSGMASLKEAQ